MRTIAQIDKDIDAIHLKMRRLERINLMSAASWQKAWDKHPRLHAKEQALYCERGKAQVIRDEKAYKDAKRVERVTNNQFCKESAAKFKAEKALNAAAPDMFAALRDLRDDIAKLKWGQSYPGRNHALMDRVDAALAKAAA